MNNIQNLDIEIISKLFKKIDSKNESTQKIFYVPNKDNTIRWIYPSTLKVPSFLAFYTVSNTRSKVIAFITKLFFYLKLNKSTTIEVSSNSIISNILNKFPNCNYSIFTGTVGLNRKALVEINKNGITKYFAKVSLTEDSKELIKNEADSLEYLDSLNLSNLKIPKIIEKNEDYIIINSIKEDDSFQINHLTNKHFSFLENLYKNTNKCLKVNKLNILDDIKKNFKNLKKENLNNQFDKQQIKNMISNLDIVIETIDLQKEIKVSMAHCDFTPWNIFINKNDISVIDWELSSNNMPILYDLFLFIFQSGILVNRYDYTKIVSEIKTSINNEIMHKTIEELDVDINLSYKMYLIYTITYYLNKYNHQEKFHDQVYWLINTWDEAIKDIINKQGKIF